MLRDHLPIGIDIVNNRLLTDLCYVLLGLKELLLNVSGMRTSLLHVVYDRRKPH